LRGKNRSESLQSNQKGDSQDGSSTRGTPIIASANTSPPYASSAAAIKVDPRVIYETQKYYWSKGEKEKALTGLTDFVGILSPTAHPAPGAAAAAAAPAGADAGPSSSLPSPGNAGGSTHTLARAAHGAAATGHVFGCGRVTLEAVSDYDERCVPGGLSPAPRPLPSLPLFVRCTMAGTASTPLCVGCVTTPLSYLPCVLCVSCVCPVCGVVWCGVVWCHDTGRSACNAY